MPFVELHNLNKKEVIKGYHARTIHTGSMTLLYWLVDEGATMPVHSHIHEQVAHVLKGKFELTVGDKTKILEPGTVAVIPPNVPHGGRAITYCELLDVFHPEREDYKFDSLK